MLWQCSTMVPLGDILYDLMYQMPKMSAFVYALCVYYVTLRRPYDCSKCSLTISVYLCVLGWNVNLLTATNYIIFYFLNLKFIVSVWVSFISFVFPILLVVWPSWRPHLFFLITTSFLKYFWKMSTHFLFSSFFSLNTF